MGQVAAGLALYAKQDLEVWPGHKDKDPDAVLAGMEKEEYELWKNRKAIRWFIDVAAGLSAREDVVFTDLLLKDNSLEKTHREFCRLMFAVDTCRITPEYPSKIPNVHSLISCGAKALLAEICSDACLSYFFALQVDLWPVGGESLFSIILRYVNKHGRIKERFLGFQKEEGQDAKWLIEHCQDILPALDLESKLVAHAYDAKALCAQDLSKLKEGVRKLTPHATLVNSYHHLQRYVFQDARVNVEEVGCFLEGLGSFRAFMSNPRRALLLISTWRALYPECPFLQLGRTLCEDMASKYDEVYESFLHIMNTRILEDDASILASTFVLVMEKFDFAFLLFTYQQVFEEIRCAFDMVKESVMDVGKCRQVIAELVKHIRSRKSDAVFKHVYTLAADLAEYPGECLRRKMEKKGLKMEPNHDPQKHFQTLYNTVLESLILQLQSRFSYLEDLGFLQLLDPSKFAQMSYQFPADAMGCLYRSYGTFFNMEHLRSQLCRFWQDASLQGNSDHLEDWIRLLLPRKSLGELYKLMCLVATLGVTPTGPEEEVDNLAAPKPTKDSTLDSEQVLYTTLLSPGPRGHIMNRLSDFSTKAVLGVKTDLQKALALMFLGNDLLREIQNEERWYKCVTAYYEMMSGHQKNALILMAGSEAAAIEAGVDFAALEKYRPKVPAVEAAPKPAAPKPFVRKIPRRVVTLEEFEAHCAANPAPVPKPRAKVIGVQRQATTSSRQETKKAEISPVVKEDKELSDPKESTATAAGSQPASCTDGEKKKRRRKKKNKHSSGWV